MVTMSSAKPSPKTLPRRFYERAAFDLLDVGYVITLDGKPVRTPAKHLLQVPSRELAAAIAAEWDAQQENINTDTMPLTRLASIAIDRVKQDRAALLNDIARYLETDLICYRVPHSEDSAALRTQQDTFFDTILAWVKDKFVASFLVTEGVMPIVQPPEAQQKIAAVFADATDMELAALAMMVPLMGSALLTLAVWKQHVGIDAALIACRFDEAAQAADWGHDPEATAAWAAKEKELRAAAFFLTVK